MFYLLDRANPNGPHFYPTRRNKLIAIVVHITAGLEDLDLRGDDMSAENTARYAATTDRAVSWHSGSDSDTWVQLLPAGYTAFQAVNYNSSTYGHEISKTDVSWNDEPAEWVTRTLRNAALGVGGSGGLAAVARAHGIPFRRATRADVDRGISTGTPVGFVAHSDLDPARRRDPGDDFPWTRFLSLMAGPPPVPPTTSGGFMSDLSSAEQRRILELAEANARVLGPLAQRVADIERRQLAINVQEQGRDAADAQRDEALAAELDQAQADLRTLLDRTTPDEPADPEPVPQGDQHTVGGKVHH